MADNRWPKGTPVEVRNRFDGAWVPGFEVAAVRAEGDRSAYELRRCSDHAVLPARFSPGELRETRR
jgi:hypothetical protein